MSENIQVAVRCRARNEKESLAKSPPVVELSNDVFSAEEPFVAVSTPQQSFSSIGGRSSLPSGKVFKVDQVYGPNADQRLLFDNVALPLFNDFINGMNVTILAYGQTGSGKTYTMCGDLEGEHAGIIPRVLSRVFSVMEGDFMVKLSCVELYKEELHDLVNDELELMPIKSKLRLISESGPGVTGSTVIHNLSEVHIDTSEMGFNILKKCLTKRKTSATKLNDLSSRSHTIFTINLYREFKTSSGASEYRVSKMNLVDLAGSEDINKSGAVNERAREAGAINQSLLTLGKVINALSEGKEQRHIPYRESKLTRLLQGSIGGKTKTALIATISPAKINAQETVSTLNYASKAKNIRNLPQSTIDSDMVLKKVLVQDLSSQISRITRDLMANRDKDNSIKMSYQNYEKLNRNVDNFQVDLKEKNTEISGLKLKLERKDVQISELQQKLLRLESVTQGMKTDLEATESNFAMLTSNFSALQRNYNIQNDKVSRLVRGNVQGLNAALEEVVNLITKDTSALETHFQSLESEVNSQFIKLLDMVAKKIKDVGALLQSHSSVVDDILRRNADITPIVEQVHKIDFSTSLLELSSINNATFDLLEMEFSPGSELNTNAVETAKRNFRKSSEIFKAQMMKQISSTVENLFEKEIQMLERPVEYASNAILRSSKEIISDMKQRSGSRIKSVLNKVDEETALIKQNVGQLQHSYNERVRSTAVDINDNLKNSTASAIHDAVLEVTRNETLCNERTKMFISAIKDTVSERNKSNADRVNEASRDLHGFVEIVSGLDNSAGGMPPPSPSRFTSKAKSTESTPINSPTKPIATKAIPTTSPSKETPTKATHVKPLARSPLSVQNSCVSYGIKRRKPSSPSKESGLLRSRIPQLFPNLL